MDWLYLFRRQKEIFLKSIMVKNILLLMIELMTFSIVGSYDISKRLNLSANWVFATGQANYGAYGKVRLLR